MLAFQYHSQIIERFPNVNGGVVLAQGMRNGPTPDALKEVFLVEQRAALERIGSTPLSELETLAAWRAAFRAFGVNPTKYRSACEALLRRLTKKGDIPSINTLVDISNLVSVRYALPVAVFDVRALHGGITVHFADGAERYTPLGRDEIEHPEVGEVVFSDETGMVTARRWCWRQSAESAAVPETRDAVVTVEAQHAGGRADVRAALDDLLPLLEQYAGGEFKAGLLGPARSSITL